MRPGANVPSIKDGDWVGIRKAIQILSKKLGFAAEPTFADVTITGITASRLVSANSSKVLESSDLSSWITGTAKQITVTDDGDGTVTLSLPTELTLESTDTSDPTLIFKTTNTPHQMNIYLDESLVNDEIVFAGQTALKNTQINIRAQDGENATLYLTSGSNFSYITMLADDRLTIANNNQNKDIFFQINDGGVTKTITWDADVDKLKHSGGTFDFDNNHLITTGTVTGADPTSSAHFTTRNYVDSVTGRWVES